MVSAQLPGYTAANFQPDFQTFRQLLSASRQGLQRDGGLLHHLGLQNMSAFVVAYLSASGHCGTGLRVLHT
jgi:hypothetical protein